MKNLSLLTLIFAVTFTFFFLLLIFFRIPFPPYPLISYQDALDLLTPLVLIPLYWLLFRSSGGVANPAEELSFMVLSATWVLGQGMHLAANSIDNLIENMAKNELLDILGSDIYQLTYFLDEHLSHYIWHIGVVGLAVLLIVHEWRRPAGVTTIWWLTALAGIIYGFSSFCIFLEGQTVPLGIPLVAFIMVTTLIWGRRRLGIQPVLAFLFISSLVALVLFVGWGLYWSGFPQFSDVGLI